jgi:hypothetical protein
VRLAGGHHERPVGALLAADVGEIHAVAVAAGDGILRRGRQRFDRRSPGQQADRPAERADAVSACVPVPYPACLVDASAWGDAAWRLNRARPCARCLPGAWPLTPARDARPWGPVVRRVGMSAAAALPVILVHCGCPVGRR